MAGFTPDEGENLICNLIYKNADANRGSSLELGLMTNTIGSLSETAVLADITEPTGGSYARKTLTDASWTVSGDNATYAQQTFTATGGAYSADVTGYFIATTGTSPKLLHVQFDTSASTMVEGADYQVDLSSVVA